MLHVSFYFMSQNISIDFLSRNTYFRYCINVVYNILFYKSKGITLYMKYIPPDPNTYITKVEKVYPKRMNNLFL